MDEQDSRPPRYIDPATEEYTNYHDHLGAFNDHFRTFASNVIQDLFPFPELGACIATTGSDARLEKGPGSPIEVTLFAGPFVKAEELATKLRTFENEHPDLLLEGVEVKRIGEDPMSYFVIPDGPSAGKRLVSPNRIMDSRLLFGDPKIHVAAKDQMVKELKSSKGNDIYDRVKDKTKEHADVTETGKQRYRGEQITHFNFDTGISTYDPQAGLWSFKQGPLRLVQYALVRDAVRSLRAGAKPSFITGLDSNTVEKLHDLYVNGFTQVSSSELGDLTDNYKFFLHQYHLSQSYAEDGEKHMPFDVKEVRERASRLAQICRNPIFSLDSSN